jgi:murein DD-endopeptidase MepM/ murein hydrolase activator NlpD
MHTGVDLHAPCGVPIMAAASGTVEYAAWNGGYGNRVIVDNGQYGSHELLTTYNHMVNFVVHVGQHVSQGQVVGHAGTFGVSTGCHLHFEVMLDSTFTNPMNFLS